jgi:hypothetical protein
MDADMYHQDARSQNTVSDISDREESGHVRVPPVAENSGSNPSATDLRPHRSSDYSIKPMEGEKILAKQGSQMSMRDAFGPGAVAVTGEAGGGDTSRLSEKQLEVLAKQRGSPSGPGAVAVAGVSSNGQMTQVERDILAKQRGASTHSLSPPRPGAVSIPGVVSNGGTVGSQLTQMESDILSKQRASSRYSMSRPGAVDVLGDGNTTHEGNGQMSQLERDVLAKQYGGSYHSATARPGATFVATGRDQSASGRANLSHMEQDVLAKQHRSGPATTRTGDIPVVGGIWDGGSASGKLTQVEQDIRAKQHGSRSAASTPGAVSVIGRNSHGGSQNGNLSQVEQDILAKHRVAGPKSSWPGTVSVAGSDGIAKIEFNSLSQMEHDIMTKQSKVGPDVARPGAVSVVPGHDYRGGRSGTLSQMEHDIMAKQLEAGNAVGRLGGQLSQVEQDILTKQRGAPPIGSFSGRPGVAMVADEGVGGTLSQMEHDILAKQQREAAGPGPTRPGAVAVSRAGAGAQFNQLAESRSAKERAGRLTSTEAPSNALSQDEHYILAKQRENTGISTPGAVAVSARGQLSQMENDVRAKQVDAAHPSVNSWQASSLSQAEHDILSKQEASCGFQAVRPVAQVVEEGKLNQMERDILAKQQEVASTTRGGLSQAEQDILTQDRSTGLLHDATAVTSGGLRQMEKDILAKQHASSRSGAQPPRSSGLGLLDQDRMSSKQRAWGFAGVNDASQLSQASPGCLNDLESEIGAKSSDATPLGYSSLATVPRGDSSRQFNGLHSLEADIRNKNGFPLSPHDASHVDQDRVQSGYEYEYGPDGPQDYVQPGNDFDYRQGGRQDHGQPDYDYEYGQGGLRDYAQTDYDHEYARSLQQHELIQRSHPERSRQIDSDLPVMNEGFDTVPQPLSVPYSFSDEPEAARSGDGDPPDREPNVDIPEGGIIAYVPPAVVEAAGVAVILSTEEEERLDKEKRKKYVFGGAICVCLVAIAIIVPTVLTAARGSAPESLALPPSMAPSFAPSVAPSSAPTSSVFADFLADVLKPLNASSDVVFDDVHSPQYKAAVWLVEEDSKYYWEQHDLSRSHPKIVQRYALATFHFATGGNKWRICGKESPNCPNVAWLSPVDECTWHFVNCGETGFVEMLDFGE